MFQDLFYSDNVKVNATLDVLYNDYIEDNKLYDKRQAVGVVLFTCWQNCLDKAIDDFPACDQVTDLNELAELTIRSTTLIAIIKWTSLHDEIKVGIKAIGGVEAIVRVLQSFPKCHDLHWRGCCAGVSQGR
jgi:hypothetical protein